MTGAYPFQLRMHTGARDVAPCNQNQTARVATTRVSPTPWHPRQHACPHRHVGPTRHPHMRCPRRARTAPPPPPTAGNLYPTRVSTRPSPSRLAPPVCPMGPTQPCVLPVSRAHLAYSHARARTQQLTNRSI